MVKPKKFRGVRQRHWGSWVSEIRHPILKRKVWLGTFDTAEEAAKLYDQAAVIMSGRVAKTNFPVSPTQNQSQCETSETRGLSEILHAKLWKCSKAPSPSVICLRLDIENSHIGVWQRRAGHPSKSSWLMRVQLRDHQKTDNIGDDNGGPTSSSSYVINPIDVRSVNGGGGDEDDEVIFNEEQRVALQMIEELLNFDTPSTAC